MGQTLLGLFPQRITNVCFHELTRWFPRDKLIMFDFIRIKLTTNFANIWKDKKKKKKGVYRFLLSFCIMFILLSWEVTSQPQKKKKVHCFTYFGNVKVWPPSNSAVINLQQTYFHVIEEQQSALRWNGRMFVSLAAYQCGQRWGAAYPGHPALSGSHYGPGGRHQHPPHNACCQ